MRAGAAGLAVRDAVRRGLADLAESDAAGSMQEGSRAAGPANEATGRLVLVACSGGPDSLALAAATAFVAPRLGLRAGAVVVDHSLQRGSEAVAAVAAAHCRDLGLDPVVAVRVEVPMGAGDGPEAAARTARYDALARVAGRQEASAVLLGHTLDDQAESVLLGLLRGSGTRALSGMAGRRGIYRRPLLGLDRATTTAACAEAGLDPWADPHNSDPAYARARARALLGELEGRLGTGVRVGLARSAELLRADDEALAAWAEQAYVDAQAAPHTSRDATCAASPDTGIEAGTRAGLECRALAALPAAIRGRVLHRAALDAGARAADLTSVQVAALDALVVDWHGQGPVDLPGGVHGVRDCGRLLLARKHAMEHARKQARKATPSRSPEE